MSINRKITHGILSGSVLTVVSIAIALLQYRFIFQYLPKELTGVWFLFITFSGYATFFDLGLGPTLAREMSFIIGDARLDAAQRAQKTANLLATCRRIYYLLSVFVLALALVAGTMYLLSVTPSQNRQEVQTAWTIFAFGAALNILGAMSFAELYGRGNVATERLTRAVAQLIGFALAVGALVAGFGLVGMACAWVAQCALARIGATYKLASLRAERAIDGHYQASVAKSIAMPSLKWAGTALGGVLILQTDNVIIASALGPAMIAHYEPVAKIIAVLMTFSMLIVTSSTPFLSQSYAAGDHAALNTHVYRNVRFSMGAMIVLVSFLCFYGDRIIGVWLSPAAFPGFPIIWIFSVMILLECHHVNLASAAMSTGKQFFMAVALIAGVLNIVITWQLAKAFGLVGVAAGTMIAQMLTNNWYVPYKSLKVLGIPFKEYARRTIVPLAGLLLLALAVNAVLSAQFQRVNALLAIVAGFTVSLLACGAWFGAFVLTRGERGVLTARFVNIAAPQDRTESL